MGSAGVDVVSNPDAFTHIRPWGATEVPWTKELIGNRDNQRNTGNRGGNEQRFQSLFEPRKRCPPVNEERHHHEHTSGQSFNGQHLCAN